MLPGDVYARYLRQEGHEVLYVCGTDEHGTPAELAAQEAAMPVEEYCAKMYDVQTRTYDGFGIQFDYFGRTSSPSNHELTTMIFEHLYNNGFIEEKFINQYYSPVDARFLPDRYVEGTCPHCGYEKARGDQCDGCGTLLDPEDLLNPYSVISKSKDLVLKQTQHFFLNIPKLAPDVIAWIEQRQNWQDIVRGIAQKWISEGLQSRCITRDLKWGIKVPKRYQASDAEDKVFYVWFDAPNGYVSITMDWAIASGDKDAWKRWWLPDNVDDVFYVEFMAKDNIPFHTIFWPAMLLGTKLPFKKVDDIKGFNWLTYDKGKFSTSQKRGVFTDKALELFPADYWRYYLLANCPESSDSDFTFESFALTVNKDLADILGNFINRTWVLLQKYFDMKLPASVSPGPKELQAKCEKIVQEISTLLSARKFRQATAALRSLWVTGNEYITENEPWSVLKKDTQAGGEILSHCVHLMRVFAIACAPFIPHTAKKIADMLNLDWEDITHTPIAKAVSFYRLKQGHVLRAEAVVFAKIDAAQVEALTIQYDGNHADS
jgi:methionyl-tRNA synthetase